MSDSIDFPNGYKGMPPGRYHHESILILANKNTKAFKERAEAAEKERDEAKTALCREQEKLKMEHEEIVRQNIAYLTSELHKITEASLVVVRERDQLKQSLCGIKLYCLSSKDPAVSMLHHIIRLCINAGIKEQLDELQKCHPATAGTGQAEAKEGKKVVQ